jgi:hypothetical protein
MSSSTVSASLTASTGAIVNYPIPLYQLVTQWMCRLLLFPAPSQAITSTARANATMTTALPVATASTTPETSSTPNADPIRSTFDALTKSVNYLRVAEHAGWWIFRPKNISSHLSEVALNLTTSKIFTSGQLVRNKRLRKLVRYKLLCFAHFEYAGRDNRLMAAVLDGDRMNFLELSQLTEYEDGKKETQPLSEKEWKMKSDLFENMSKDRNLSTSNTDTISSRIPSVENVRRSQRIQAKCEQPKALAVQPKPIPSVKEEDVSEYENDDQGDEDEREVDKTPKPASNPRKTKKKSRAASRKTSQSKKPKFEVEEDDMVVEESGSDDPDEEEEIDEEDDEQEEEEEEEEEKAKPRKKKVARKKIQSPKKSSLPKKATPPRKEKGSISTQPAPQHATQPLPLPAYAALPPVFSYPQPAYPMPYSPFPAFSYPPPTAYGANPFYLQQSAQQPQLQLQQPMPVKKEFKESFCPSCGDALYDYAYCHCGHKHH